MNGCDDQACCLKEGHAGLHRYRCCSPACPGYTWKASEDPHPAKTCTENGVLPGLLEPRKQTG